MRSRTSFVRIQAAEEVRASLATYSGKIAGHLDGRFTQAPAEGEPEFTYQGLFVHLDQELEAVQQGLVDAEDAHLRKKIEVSNARGESEDLTQELYDLQVSARRAVASAFDRGKGYEVAAIKGSTPQDLWGLVDQVDQTVKLLEAPASELPAARVEDGVNIAAFAQRLGIGLGQLREAGVRLGRARKAAAESLIAKNEAIAEFNAVFPWVAQTLEGLFRLAGETELADRIRTSARQVTRKQAAGEEGGEEGGEGSTQDPSGEGGASEPSEPGEATTSPVS